MPVRNVPEPMLATLALAPLDDPDYVYEPKYDGIRAIAVVEPGGASVRLWSRLGNEKTAQFPEVATALSAWAKRRREPVVLDGEIVALDAKGEPTGFQNLQGRIHLGSFRHGSGAARRARPARPRAGAGDQGVPVAFIAFDLLRDGDTDWRDRPLTERRAALERLFSRTGTSTLRLSEQARGDGRALQARATAGGWERL